MSSRDPLDDLARRMAESEDPLQPLNEIDETTAADVDALLDRLESVGADERRTLAEASSLRGVPGEGEVEDFVRAAAARQAGSATSMRAFAAAAAFLLALAAVYFSQRYFDQGEGGAAPQLLGNGALELSSPLGEVPSFVRFEWEGELEPGHWFEVTLYADDDGLAGSELFSSGHLEAPAWRPTEAELADLPTSFVWEVVVRDAGGERVESRQALVRRSE